MNLNKEIDVRLFVKMNSAMRERTHFLMTTQERRFMEIDIYLELLVTYVLHYVCMGVRFIEWMGSKVKVFFKNIIVGVKITCSVFRTIKKKLYIVKTNYNSESIWAFVYFWMKNTQISFMLCYKRSTCSKWSHLEYKCVYMSG